MDPSGSVLPLDDELAAVFARMAGLLLTHETVATALGLLTAAAVEIVPGSVGAGITLVDERGRRTSAATDERVQRADALQYEHDEGPCLTAAVLQQVVRVDDVTEDPRWPRWGQAAGSLGLRAALSAPLVAGNQGLGAMKVYAEQPRAFDARAERLMTLFAGQAAILVANVQASERAERLTAGLRQAVHDRDAVGVAKGVLMARHGVDEDAAFSILLARAAQDAVPLREVAHAVAGSAVRRRR